MPREFNLDEKLDPKSTLKGLITQLRFCKEGFASFHNQPAESKLALAEKVIRELQQFFGTTETYFIKVLDQTIDALTDRDSNGQRHVRQPHLLDQLTRNLIFGESELAELRTRGAGQRLSMMEEVFTGARAIYRTNGENLPPFFEIMELTLNALTDNVADEYGQRRRRVRDSVCPNATTVPFPAPRSSEPLPALPALMDEEEEEEEGSIKETRCLSIQLSSSSEEMEINEPVTRNQPADAKYQAERLAQRATSREMLLKEHPAYRALISEWLAHSSTVPFEVTSQQSIQVGVTNLVLGISHNLCQPHASLFWATIRFVALHHRLKRASQAEISEVSGIMKQANLHSCEMERRYAGFFAELYDILGGGFLIVAAKDLIALRKSFKPFKGAALFNVSVRDKFKAARRSLEECIDREDPAHAAGLTVYDKAITTIIDSIIADDQPRVDNAVREFESMAARH
ncbi:hypothetical protein BDZ88DRAFT_456134 [Geranomyces variabilis]|nr:hypothetical protein BDZ88DRAFT_456134 [Geranomyces variabilis]KAJ3131321.1 hypothetical protein HDU90_008593 [Geranomyces variabilis]